MAPRIRPAASGPQAMEACHTGATMPQPILATFSFDVGPGLSPAERSALLAEIQAELTRPGRRFEPRLFTTFLVRFDDASYDAFIQKMDGLRARHGADFRYLSVGWDATRPVDMNPKGPAVRAVAGPGVALALKNNDPTGESLSESILGKASENDRPVRRRAAGTRKRPSDSKGKRATKSSQRKPRKRTR